jgi:hypothetical protein
VCTCGDVSVRQDGCMVRIRKRNFDGRVWDDDALRAAFTAVGEWTSHHLGEPAARFVVLDASDGDEFQHSDVAAAWQEVDDAGLTVVRGRLDMWSPLSGNPHVRTTVRFTDSSPHVIKVTLWGDDVAAVSEAEAAIAGILQHHA